MACVDGVSYRAVWGLKKERTPHHSYACYRVYLKITLTTGVESPVSKVSGGKEATVTSQGHVSGLPGWRKLWCLEAIPWHAPWFLVTFFHNWVTFCLSGSYLSLYKEKRYLHTPEKQCWCIFLSKLLGKERAMLCLVTQLCPTLCNPMDCSPPGSSVHGILQAKILEWVATSFSRGSQPRDWTQVTCIASRFFTV